MMYGFITSVQVHSELLIRKGIQFTVESFGVIWYFMP
jgi:hypothetical protein